MENDNPSLFLVLDSPKAEPDTRLFKLLDFGCLSGVASSNHAIRNACRNRVAFFVHEDPKRLQDLDADGILLKDPKAIAALRKQKGNSLLIGAYCGVSRHEAMVAGDAGADYLLIGNMKSDGETSASELVDFIIWANELTTLPFAVCGWEGLLDTQQLIEAGSDMLVIFEQEVLDIYDQALTLADQLGWIEGGTREQ